MSARKINLKAELQAEIAAQGPMPFLDYMGRCLKHYYSHLQAIGSEGDFVTAPQLGPYFADALAHALAPHLADCPTIVELGAGTGQLAVDLLQQLEQLQVLPKAYIIQETSPSLRAIQADRVQQLPARLAERVQWGLSDQIAGLLIANEVFDALPVERFIQTAAGKKRRGVDYKQDHFVEVTLDEPIDFAVPEVEFAEGYASEFCPGLGAFLDTILPYFQKGMAWIIDYGYERQEYYAPYRPNGTLQAYFQHQLVSPFFKPGAVDLTAHVDFTTLAELFIARGWRIDFLKPQNRFLLEEGVLERYPLTPEHYALKRLLDPRLMGEHFKVMRAEIAF